MLKYLLIISFFSLISLKAQLNPQFLINNWVKTKTRMLDSSKDLSVNYSDSNYFALKIDKEKLCFITNPITINDLYSSYPRNEMKENCVKYTLENNYIKISPISEYKVEKLTKDSLIIVHKMKDINEPDRLRRFWFVKSTQLMSNNSLKFLKDSILIASPNFTPNLIKDFTPEIEGKFLNNKKYPEFIMMGSIIINPKNENIRLEIDNIEDEKLVNNKESINFIKSIIENSYHHWNITNFKKFNKIYIPFTIESKTFKFSKEGLRDASSFFIYYFIKNIDYYSELYGLDSKKISLRNENFNKGLKFFQEKEYEKANIYFIKSYEIDNYDVDALYNISSIFGLTNDKTNECKYLKILKELEQTEGTKQYNKKCVN